MARPRKAIRPIEKRISIDEDLVALAELELWSDIESQVPFGSWSRYINRVIREDLQRRGVMK